MNNSSLPIKAFLGVLLAIILLPFGGAAAAIAFTATGLLSILAADYGRNLEPVRVTASVVPFEGPGRGPAVLSEAA
jgi:hypothetical protein